MKKEFDKVMISRAVIEKIRDENNPKVIKSKYNGTYDMPNKISMKGKEEVYTPDITAMYGRGTYIYEIEIDLHDSIPIQKWRLLALYARQKHGNLYLVVPDYLKETIKEEIKNNDINAGIIYFKTK